MIRMLCLSITAIHLNLTKHMKYFIPFNHKITQLQRSFFLLSAILLIAISTKAQGIRKSYSEMTEIERINLVNAFYQLRFNGDLINDLAVFHGQFFDFTNTSTPNALDIHLNLPNQPQNEIFLAWHRRQLFELEQAMQDLDPYTTIPYWNSAVDQSPSSPLWDFNFMGQFNTDWSLNRNLGANGPLPTPTNVTNTQALTNFFDFSNVLERQAVHNGAHRWVGGAMSATVSPRDPVFYLHHSWVDKQWKDWEDVHQSSAYLRTDMIRYDGTYSFNGQVIPAVNPNDITDSRVYGVFYADNQLADLDDYTVNNTYNPEELFFYQYTIQAGDGFEVPAGRTARIESTTTVRLLPGFHAANGSSFTAAIGNGTMGMRDYPIIMRNQVPWDNRGVPIRWNACGGYDEHAKTVFAGDIKVYPNPFTDHINMISPNSCDTWLIEIYDLSGRKLKSKYYAEVYSVIIDDLSSLSSGTYVLKLTINGNMEQSSLIIKQ